MTHVDTSANAPYQLLPPLSPEERVALKEDIRRRGVAVAIEFDGDGNVLDGHHRLAIYNELVDEGWDGPMYDQKVVHFETEDAKRDYVLALNLKRRHLTGEQKAILFARLRMPPYSMTLQAIADLAQVGVGTVHRHLDELPDDVQDTLAQLETIGKDGKVYPATYAYVTRTIIPSEKAERDFTAQRYSSGDQSAEIPHQYMVVITCTDEAHQASVLEGLAAKGLDCKAIIS